MTEWWRRASLPLRRLMWVAGLVALVPGCVGDAAPTRNSPPPTSTLTPTGRPMATPPPRPTAAPTATPMPTPTPTAMPTPTPVPLPTPIPFWDRRLSSPDAQGTDSETLVRMLDYIADHEVEAHSVLIVRNGYLVLEAYFHPYHRGRAHRLTSCTKSFLSALIGVASEEGHLNLDDKVLGFFPDRTIENHSPLKREVTVEHLLRMRSGLDWPESSVSYSSADNILWRMMGSSDWTQFALDRSMAAEPGTAFNYSTGDPQLLGAVLEEATGLSVTEFARTRLFEPLGVSPAHWSWRASPEGVAFGGGGLSATPRAMAKFGYLYLSEGDWNGEQIIPAGWVEASTAEPHYGYQWWCLGNGGYAALGYGGQRIAVMPDLDMVIVVTADMPGATSRYLVDAFILPAARSSEPLPENPEALALLEARVEDIKSP